ncbi:hypothetical protein [Flavobacterium caseinilyticum]|uniref:DUF1351 domain-containing protein n=1 Tax=Flavobacterium caseinilyticum TaxID=2541732 RepID=A0A4R5B0N7_9FLAO|nr:hypothetical protein [Flavobacterium caseinilyticum]TDD77084.1 hypothetical protein E0F89_05660 [Flavobacterium caseinilyticum]
MSNENEKKELPITEKGLISIQDLTPANFLNVDLFKSNQQQLIDNNPVIEIVDEATFKISDTSRKALKKGRTTTNASKKIDIDALKNNILEPLIATYDEIATMTQPLEELHDANCEAWKAKIAAIEKAKAEAEELRKSTIKNTIAEFQDTWNDKLTKLDYNGIEALDAEFTKFTEDLVLEDFQEFQIEFSVKHQAVLDRLKSSVTLLTQNEETRLENERLLAYNVRLEALLFIGATISELGITLVNTATEDPSEFVSKENLKSMTVEDWNICCNSFIKVNKANEAKILEDRSKARVKQIKDLSFVLNKENKSYDFELKDKSKIECFFSHIKSGTDVHWNDLIKDWNLLIEEDKKPIPEPVEEIAAVIPKVSIPAENIVVIEAKVVVPATPIIEQPKPIKVTAAATTIEEPEEVILEGWPAIVLEYFNSAMEEPTLLSFLSFLEENYNPPTPK